MKQTYRVLLGLTAFMTIAFGATPKESTSKAVVPVSVKKETRCSKHALTFYTGSLRDNLTRLASSYGWKDIVWLPRNDYQWHGRVTLQGKSLDRVLTQVLKRYPLQAQFYDGNHILVVAPRTL